MKILYITLDLPLHPDSVATGNQVRAQGILEALQQAGHTVIQSTPANESNREKAGNIYETRSDLEKLIAGNAVNSILVGYWSLLAHLPESNTPVILDFIAPRMLELMFQEPERFQVKTKELIHELGRADHFLVGNQRQSDLLLPLLLQAGFDCRWQTPISIVPISTRGNYSSGENSSELLRVVNAGVDWPWRNTQAYREVMHQLMRQDKNLEFVELTGNYPGEKFKSGESSLQSYSAMQDTLQSCDIGLELGKKNTEREFSHSFRSMEYLENGLPIIINAWIPLADFISQHDAGWVIQDPAELSDIINSLQKDRTILETKRAGVRALICEKLNYAKSCKPLLDYLSAPQKALRTFKYQQPQNLPKETPVLQKRRLLFSLLRKVFFSKRPESTPDILMVTRADLFPADHGAAVKIIRTAEALSRQGRDVWLMTDNRREYYQFTDGAMVTHRYPFYIRYLCLPRLIAFARLLLKGYPVSNHFLYLPVTDSSYIFRALWLVGRLPIGAYQAEFPAYVRPLRFARALFGGKVLLVQHNVEYERIRNQVQGLSERNYHTLKNLEVAMCQIADTIVTVSDNDRNTLINVGIDAGKIHTIPHGVDLQAFRETRACNIHGRYGLPVDDKVLIYHGTYSYPPNLEAMEVMAKEILPRLEKRKLQVSVLAIGSKPPHFPLHEKIYFTGSVENLAEVIPAADLAVVTLLEGGGTRMKILDYFAAGVPVISTSKGIEGIPVEHGKQAMILDDYEAICDAIELLLSDSHQAEALAKGAGDFVAALDWDAIVKRYLQLLQ